MTTLAPHYTNEETGISYTLSPEGYYLPDLVLPEEPAHDIGRFGRMRRHYLQNHRSALLIDLLTSGKLNEHLYEIDQTATKRMELLTAQMAAAEGVTEELKSRDQMLWIRRMNNIRARAEDVIREELIYG
jgi:hypothetical protein